MKKANAQNSRPNKSQVLTEFLKGLLAQGPVGVPEIEDMAEGGWTPGQKAIDHALEAVSGGEEDPWDPIYSGRLCNRGQMVLAFAGSGRAHPGICESPHLKAPLRLPSSAVRGQSRKRATLSISDQGHGCITVEAMIFK